MFRIMKNLEIRKYTEKEFNNSDSLLLFKANEYSKVYAELTLCGSTFRVSWASDQILPCCYRIRDDIYGVAVDQNFAILNVKTMEVLLRLNLDAYFMTMQLQGSLVYLATELEVIAIDSKTFAVINRTHLPDIFKKFDFNGSIFKAICMDQTEVSF